MRRNKSDEQHAEEMLRRFCPAGSKIKGVVTNVARSGMSRSIRFFVVSDGEMQEITGYICTLGIAGAVFTRHGARVPGCGMDMIFHTIHSLSYRLYNDGYALTQQY